MMRPLGPPASSPARLPQLKRSVGETPAVQGALVVEGYAALFGVADQMRDIIRAGAFGASLARRAEPLPMLIEHERRLLAGYWNDVREDARGLFLRGAITDDQPGAARARRMIALGIDGLSIGFVPIVAHRSGDGRTLIEVELLEVSIVTHPMQPLARFRQSPAGHRQAGFDPTAQTRLPTAA